MVDLVARLHRTMSWGTAAMSLWRATACRARPRPRAPDRQHGRHHRRGGLLSSSLACAMMRERPGPRPSSGTWPARPWPCTAGPVTRARPAAFCSSAKSRLRAYIVGTLPDLPALGWRASGWLWHQNTSLSPFFARSPKRGQRWADSFGPFSFWPCLLGLCPRRRRPSGILAQLGERGVLRVASGGWLRARCSGTVAAPPGKAARAGRGRHPTRFQRCLLPGRGRSGRDRKQVTRARPAKPRRCESGSAPFLPILWGSCPPAAEHPGPSGPPLGNT
jgi:hypothetical protein